MKNKSLFRNIVFVTMAIITLSAMQPKITSANLFDGNENNNDTWFEKFWADIFGPDGLPGKTDPDSQKQDKTPFRSEFLDRINNDQQFRRDFLNRLDTDAELRKQFIESLRASNRFTEKFAAQFENDLDFRRQIIDRFDTDEQFRQGLLKIMDNLNDFKEFLM